MKRVGETAGISTDAKSDMRVLDYMHSLEDISTEEYETAKQFLETRNRAVHSVDLGISKATVLEMYQHTKRQLEA